MTPAEAKHAFAKLVDLRAAEEPDPAAYKRAVAERVNALGEVVDAEWEMKLGDIVIEFGLDRLPANFTIPAAPGWVN
jgi:hypothetical protein